MEYKKVGSSSKRGTTFDGRSSDSSMENSDEVCLTNLDLANEDPNMETMDSPSPLEGGNYMFQDHHMTDRNETIMIG